MNNFVADLEVNKYLDDVKKVIDMQLTTQEHEFSETVKKYFNDRAKLIRPILTLIAASYKNEIRESEIMCAAAMEILHVATLVHDDIIDESFSRRGIETINKTHGVGYALICGDYLFSKSYEMLFKTKNFKALEYIGTNTVDMCMGEATQYLNRANSEITIETYYNIIDKKTASLFQSNLVVGAKQTTMKKKDVENLIEFGKYFGRIFQIIDDLRDFTSSIEEFGKPVLHDISKGVYSLPIIIAKKDNTLINSILDEGNVDDIISLIEKDNVVDETKQHLNNNFDKAYEVLNSIDSSIANELKKVLKTVGEIL